LALTNKRNPRYRAAMPPTVLSELETVRLLRDERRSLARLGDGELGIAVMNKGAPGQVYDGKLARRLREVLASDLPGLLVAIPNIWNAPIPKARRRNWEPWTRPERMGLYRPSVTYGSAFCSRPDYFGRPFGPEYWNTMRSIWAGRPMLAVCGEGFRPKNLGLFDNTARLGLKACLPRDAWSEYPRLLTECLAWGGAWHGQNPVFALMAGPLATVMAHDLCKAGYQALDLGKAPRFYRKEMAGNDV
jgi:hypothetical protein